MHRYLGMTSLYLSESQKQCIHKFNETNTPLVIWGCVGCGKTTLAKILLSETKLTLIDSSHIRLHREIDILLDNLNRGNITMMFQSVINKRGLLVDDLQLYYREDKKTYSRLVAEGLQKRSRVKIVYTCDKSMMSHRKFTSNPWIHLHLKRTPSLYYRVCKQMCPQLSHDVLDQKIYNSHGNLHKLMNDSQDEYDVFDDTESAICKLLSMKTEIDLVTRISQGNESIIGLNLLDNAVLVLPKTYWTRVLPKIYKWARDGDTMETFMIRNHLWEFQEYVIVNTVYPYQLYPKTNTTRLPFNKYISRSLAQIHSQKQHSNMNQRYLDPVLRIMKRNSDITTESNRLQGIKITYMKQLIQMIKYYYKINNKTTEKQLISWVSSTCN